MFNKIKTFFTKGYPLYYMLCGGFGTYMMHNIELGNYIVASIEFLLMVGMYHLACRIDDSTKVLH